MEGLGLRKSDLAEMSLEKILEGFRNIGAGNIFPLQVSNTVKILISLRKKARRLSSLREVYLFLKYLLLC